MRDCGTPLVDDPGRVAEGNSLGIDETAFLRANAEHPTRYVAGLVDLERRVIIDMVEGNRVIDVSRWLSSKDEAFLAGMLRSPAERCGTGSLGRLGTLRVPDNHAG